jgi:hypothetical protein
MFRIALFTVCFGLMIGLAGLVRADDKKEVTLEGKITCAKCDLKVEKSCHTVIVVKEDGKDVTYYFDDASGKKNHSKICTSPMDGKVTGTVSEKDGKKTITVTNIEFK